MRISHSAQELLGAGILRHLQATTGLTVTYHFIGKKCGEVYAVPRCVHCGFLVSHWFSRLLFDTRMLL